MLKSGTDHQHAALRLASKPPQLQITARCGSILLFVLAGAIVSARYSQGWAPHPARLEEDLEGHCSVASTKGPAEPWQDGEWFVSPISSLQHTRVSGRLSEAATTTYANRRAVCD